MKKFVLIASALCMAMVVSCNKVTEDSINPSRDGVSSVNLVEYSFPVRQELTKSYLDGTTFKWEEGDKVALCYGSTVAPFTYNSETDRFKGEIEAGASGPFYVVSPYRDDIAIVGGKVQTVLPATQKAGAHNADPAAFVAVGQASDAAALDAGVTLRNAFSLVRVTITDTDVTSISFEGNPDGAKCSPALAGPVQLDPASAAFECDSRNLAVTLVPESSTFAAGSYDLAVLPQNLEKGLKIVFKRDGQALANYKISSSAKQLERNKGIELPSFDVAGIETKCRYIQSADDMKAWDAVAYADFTEKDIIYLGEDIDMSSVTDWVPVDQFIGTFDGQNHRIYNFSVTTNEYVGMIRITKDEAVTSVIKNFVFGSKDGETWDGKSTLTHAASASTGWYYAGVVGKTQATASMENVVNYANIVVDETATAKTRIAGICGNWASTSTLKGCVNYGNVSNKASSGDGDVVGGIVAQVDADVTIENCINYGSLLNNNPDARYVGGIVGKSGNKLTIKNCENQGDVKVTAMRVTAWGATGGLIGYVINSTIQDCKVSGASVVCEAPIGNLVANQEWRVPLGGFIGYSEKNTIKDCTIEKSDVSSTCWCVGGFVGNTENAVLFDNCKVDNCTVSGYTNVGGFGGKDLSKTKFQDCQVIKSTISGNNVTGGFFGLSSNGGIFTGCSVQDSEVKSTAADAGGFAGVVQNSTLADCSVSNAKVSAADGRAGGIVGWAMYYKVSDSELAGSTIKGCKVNQSSSISGSLNIGGIAGWFDIGEVTNCSVSDGTSVVGSGDGVGGIIGRAIAKNGNPNLIDNCFVDGATVTGAYSVGGIVGYEYPDANGPVDIYNCGVSASSSLVATACDTGGDPTKGDSMIGGIAGWVRCKDSGSTFKIVNCYSHASIACDLAMAHPSAGGILGYVSLNSAGTGLIQNCTSNITADRLQVGGAAVTGSATQYGALYGLLPNHAGITVSNCYYVEGLPIGEAGAGVVLSGNEAFAAASYTSSAKDKLNLNAAAYTAHTLYGWKAQDSLPVLSDATFTSLPGGGTEHYGDETPFTW